MTLESVDMGGPEATERNQPVLEFLKRLRVQAVETALGVHGGLDEAGVAQDAQVLGDGGLGHTKLTLDSADGLM